MRRHGAVQIERPHQDSSGLVQESRFTQSRKHLSGERPERFERLCYGALAEGAISEPKTAELLNISVRELNRRMEEPAAKGSRIPALTPSTATT